MSQSSNFCRYNPLCCFSTSNTKDKSIYRYDLVRKRLDTPSYQLASLCRVLLGTSCSMWNSSLNPRK